MTSVWPALWPPLETNDALCHFGQPVDQLALAFITPLGTDDDDISTDGFGRCIDHVVSVL